MHSALKTHNMDAQFRDHQVNLIFLSFFMVEDEGATLLQNNGNHLQCNVTTPKIIFFIFDRCDNYYT
jgi:hypothetical protein